MAKRVTSADPVQPKAGVRAALAGWISQAVATVPALRYALALGVIAALVAIVAGFLDWRVAVFGILVLLLMMTVLIVVSRLAEDRGISLRIAIYLLVYFSIAILFLVTGLFTLTFFVRPETLRANFHLNSFYEMVGLQPSEAVQKRNAGQYITEFDDALGGAATPTMVAAAIERTTVFWRQPEQRGILRGYRCGDPSSKIIFDKSAQYVFANSTLMADVDTVTRYYDSVARCVLRGECDVDQVCGYFGQQMDDFQRQYTTYFREIRILEGHDPIANVRQLVFKTCPKRDEPPVGHEALDCKAQGNPP